MQVFKNSRALLIRVSEFSNLGTQATHPDEDVSISYNRLNKKTMTQILTEHAESHDGKVLIPFGCNVRVENMHLCGQLFLRRPVGRLSTISNTGTISISTVGSWMISTRIFRNP